MIFWRNLVACTAMIPNDDTIEDSTFTLEFTKNDITEDSVRYAKVYHDVDSIVLVLWYVRRAQEYTYVLTCDTAYVMNHPSSVFKDTLRLNKEIKQRIEDYVYHLFVIKDSAIQISRKDEERYESDFLDVICYKKEREIGHTKMTPYLRGEIYSLYFEGFYDMIRGIANEMKDKEMQKMRARLTE